MPLQDAMKELADSIRGSLQLSVVTSWDPIGPPEEALALESLNTIIQQQHQALALTHEVLRWRMTHAFRYLRRDIRRIGGGLVA